MQVLTVKVYMPVDIERRRPASAAIVVSAIQTAMAISLRAMLGVRERSEIEIATRKSVEAKPMYGRIRENLITVTSIANGATNGRNQSRKNAGSWRLPSHQVGLPIARAEKVNVNKDPVINICEITTAFTHGLVNEPAASVLACEGGGSNDISRTTIA
ncbi:MAG: hypothetical protein NT119_06710 [Actinobacteria bacterium]|nr:hypothetical protein [Actinomycetota bacterium]